MPRYFFEIEDVHFLSDDKEGFELASVEAACDEALGTIGAIIADELVNGQTDIPVTVKIRTKDGVTVAEMAVRTRLTSADLTDS